MFIDLTSDQLALRDELRGYFARLLTPGGRATLRTERHGDVCREVVRRMGRDGWLGVGWPTEYGGRGLGQVEQQIFVSEAARADIPLPAVTLQTVGPTLQAHGTQQQKDFFLPRILAGQLHFAIGYTEPQAGADLAALRTRAVRVKEDAERGEEYLVNGQKIFTTGAHEADYVWLACRTDPSAPRHRGISILIVDTTDPGFSCTPIITHDGAHHVNATYYTDVRVPVSMRVGPDGRPLLTEPDVRRALARSYASLRVNELLNWQVVTTDEVDIADASATKVYSSIQVQQLGQLLEEVVARHGDPADPETAELAHWLDVQAKRNIVLTFGGGSNEILRELIATAGLRLPRVPR
jgi:3-oxo-4-pregnene-20-carboxyl-CoA dehydrogenase beta subunit